MKLLCCGDFHIGAGADYGSLPGDRLRDQEDVLARVASVAFDEKVDAVLFAGDAFERRSPTPAEFMVWRRFRDTFREPGMPPLLSIAGNHDVSTTELPTAMEVVGSCGRRPEVSHLGGGIALATLPWTPPARLVADAGGGDRDAIRERAAELLLETARDLRAQIDGTAILLAHWSVSGASLPNGLPVDQLREPVLDYSALAEQGWDYVVLGHIHRAQHFHWNPHLFYVGSPMPLNFGEERDEHGVYVIDTKRSQEPPQFIPIESRPFVTVDFDLTGEEGDELGLDETDWLASAIACRFPLTDAVVRIRYRATAEQARRVDHAALRGLVADAGASKLYAIQPEIVRGDRARVEGVDETLSEHDALVAWTESQGIGGPREEALEQLTARYLEEVRG